jgi:crossover junction endodeoxyribonuclease RuvC
MKRIIGVDPGLLHTGWAVVETAGADRRYVASGVVLPPAKAPLADRLFFIFDGLGKIIDGFGPDECALEITFSNANPKTTLLLGHARSAAMVAAAARGIPVFEYEPNKIKKAVACAGHAGKEQIHKMLKMLLPAAQPKTADEADAIAIALAHSNTGRLVA